MLGTGGSHKWVTQVFTEGSILAGKGHTLLRIPRTLVLTTKTTIIGSQEYGGNLTDRPVFPPPTLS